MTPPLSRHRYMIAAFAVIAAHSASAAESEQLKTDLAATARAAEAQLHQSFAWLAVHTVAQLLEKVICVLLGIYDPANLLNQTSESNFRNQRLGDA